MIFEQVITLPANEKMRIPTGECPETRFGFLLKTPRLHEENRPNIRPGHSHKSFVDIDGTLSRNDRPNGFHLVFSQKPIGEKLQRGPNCG